MSETQDLEPQQPKPTPYIPGQPLPRLWKTEPDPSEEEELEETEDGQVRKKAAKKGEEDGTAPKKPVKKKATFSWPKPEKTKPKTKSKSKPKSDGDGEPKEKRVLLEETPTFDTVEARHRARLIVGVLTAFCMFLVFWITYRVFLYNPSEVDLASESPSTTPPLPQDRPPVESEARYLFNRARDFAKAGRTDQAIGLLNSLVSRYKMTQAAAEARIVLERPARNIPLFPEGPVVLAEKHSVAPSVSGTAPGNPPRSDLPPTGMPRVATGPLAMLGPEALTKVQPPGQSPQPPPASPQPMQPQPAAPQPTQPPPASPQPMQPQPTPSQPTQPQPAAPQPTQPQPPPPQPTPSQPTQPQPQPAAPQPTQPPPASPQPMQPQPTPSQPTQPQPAAPQPTQPQPPPPQPTPSQPTQPQALPGPGQAVIVVPDNPPRGAEMPAPDTRSDANKTDIVSRSLPSRKLPPGFEPKGDAGYHESGWPLAIVGRRDGSTMVLVPGGTFIMGNDRGELNERPPHTVRVSTFYIDQYEVTNRQFRTFLDETHWTGLPPGKWLTDKKRLEAPESLPANYVDYHDAENFALWAGKRLATEAQWEMAARSGDGRRYPWGDQSIQWSRHREFRQVDPVMSFQEDVSPYGVFDMAGNATEWVRDWYDPKYFEKQRDKIVENPTGPPNPRGSSIQRVVKGGSKNWIVSARQGFDVDRRLPYLGFRCSLAVEGPEASAGINPHPEKTKKPSTNFPTQDAVGGQTIPF